ncbi:MAG: hypothetical protein U0840_05345 [Gemmataceae bacterium]
MSAPTTRSHRPVPPGHSTRQQLDELDALLQRMLELPVSRTEPEPPPEVASRPARIEYPSPPPQPRVAAPYTPPVYPQSYTVVETTAGSGESEEPISPRRIPETSAYPFAGHHEPPRMQQTRSGPAEFPPYHESDSSPPQEEPGRSRGEPVYPQAYRPLEYPGQAMDAGPTEEDWVPLRSSWQPSAQTWKPLVDTWEQTREPVSPPSPMPGPTMQYPAMSGPAMSPPVAPPMVPPMPSMAMPRSIPMPEPPRPSAPPTYPGAGMPVFPTLAPAETPRGLPPVNFPAMPPASVEPAPAPNKPAVEAPRKSAVPLALWPAVLFNATFDVCLLPLGPVGKWFKEPTGRGVLGTIGLLAVVAALALAAADGIGWTR